MLTAYVLRAQLQGAGYKLADHQGQFQMWIHPMTGVSYVLYDYIPGVVPILWRPATYDGPEALVAISDAARET